MKSRVPIWVAVASLMLGLVCGFETRAADQSEASTVSEIKVADSIVEVRFAPGDFDLPRTEILDWIAQCARAVAQYYGRFPVSRVRLMVAPVSGNGVRNGTTFGYPRALIKIGIGRASTRAILERDWVLTHEMVHLAFPSMPDENHWIEEGIATYVEPLARRQIGKLSEEKVWADLIAGLPKGQPAAGDRGLDYTHTWGRTYWGGALFCLLADVGIRERTKNRYGLRDALRAINAAGGSIEVDWTLKRTFEIGDRATGVPVLLELYERMRAASVQTDLDDLWRRLGIKVVDDRLEFLADAPLAPIRRAIAATGS